MMKIISVLGLLFIHSLASGQMNVVVYDKTFKVPVENAKAYNKGGNFAGLSNEKGQIELDKAGYPYEIKCVGYEFTVLKERIDTLVLVPRYQLVEEVSVKPVNLMELYNAIIETSSANVDRGISKDYGTFFESVLMIDRKYRDTVRMEAICDLAILKSGSKKKVDYTFYCTNGRKSFSYSGSGKGNLSNSSSDTLTFTKLLGVIPSFGKYLDYDLTKSKKYELNFEDKEILRELGDERSKLKFSSTDKHSVMVNVEYQDSILYSWREKRFQEKEYDGSGIFVNFKVDNKVVEFSEAEPYGFRTIIANELIQIGLSGVLYDIYMVKGYISNDAVSFEIKDSVKNVEDYLEALKNGKDMPSFYNFEIEK